jgi:hypothetical protein
LLQEEILQILRSRPDSQMIGQKSATVSAAFEFTPVKISGCCIGAARAASVLTFSHTHQVVRCYLVYRPGMRRSRWRTRPGAYFGDNPMREYNEYVARAAVCEQRAKENSSRPIFDKFAKWIVTDRVDVGRRPPRQTSYATVSARGV